MASAAMASPFPETPPMKAFNRVYKEKKWPMVVVEQSTDVSRMWTAFTFATLVNIEKASDNRYGL